MPLFQNVIIKKYIEDLNLDQLNQKFQEFSKVFLNQKIQQNILDSKEEQYQEGFLIDLFVNVLGYTLNPSYKFNLITEKKNETDSGKADAAIINEGIVIGVIELKSTKTIDLQSFEKQAFEYKNKQRGCSYIILSNFKKIRLYIDNAVEFEEFDLFNLNFDNFKRLWVCFSKDFIIKDIPKQLKLSSSSEEEKITKELYRKYATFRTDLFKNIAENNPTYDKLLLFQKTQKLLDRFLFLFFAEDRGLVPPYWTRKILKDWVELRDRFDNYIPLYSRFRKNFDYLNQGYSGRDGEIFAYNGGLFAPDDVLDNLLIDDILLEEGTKSLSNYDFDTEIDVNILGHIFEHSLNELESLEAKDEKSQLKDFTISKRKKDGVFYTPKYITKYIIDKTIGELCENYKLTQNFKIEDYEYIEPKAKGKAKLKREMLNSQLNDYRNWLLKLKIIDPACGSGAFLNQALDFLISEHFKIDELRARLLGGGLVLSDIENSILENNLYGVDINEEAIEIAKLSLWLRTARKGRKLNSLNNNIKCGNSIIEEASSTDKPFKWKNEFKEVFENGGFDVVIGNPPYGAYLDAKAKQNLSKSMDTFQGNYEIYFFFIELVSKLLKDSGKLGYITPDTWISIPQATKLRNHVLENYGINNIITFSHSVFEDASVNAIVFILSYKDYCNDCTVINFRSKVTDISYSDALSRPIKIEDWRLSGDHQFQVFQDDDDNKIIKKIENQSNQAGQFLDVSQGIVPYSTENLTKEEVKNRIFHDVEKKDDSYGVWIQGRAVSRYSISLSESEFIKYGNWLHRPRKYKYFSGERILIQEITGGQPPRISASFYEDILFHDPGVISCLNKSNLEIKYLLAVINSKLISWYNFKTSPKGNRTTFPKVLISDIRRMPIMRTSEEKQQLISQAVDSISDNTFEFNKIKQKFKVFFKAKFGIDKISNKLENWHELDFSVFFIEINKILKKNKLSTLTKIQEFEFMEVFEHAKKELKKFELSINKLDKSIDSFIYEIYGIDDEDLQVIERG